MAEVLLSVYSYHYSAFRSTKGHKDTKNINESKNEVKDKRHEKIMSVEFQLAFYISIGIINQELSQHLRQPRTVKRMIMISPG